MIAHIVFEADSALRVGCGDANMLFDSPIQRDFNEMPMILGTSLCGVIRSITQSHLGKAKVNDLFGKEEIKSKLIFSNAMILDDEMQVNERLIPLDRLANHHFLKHFLHLPQRQHNRISHNGTCEDGGKFDEDIIFKGTRFKFSISLQCKDESDKEDFFSILNLLYLSYFRLGAGKTKGFGKIKILNISYDNLKDVASASLNESLKHTFNPKDYKGSARFIRYILCLKPENSFIFGSGFGDLEVDSVGVMENIIDYETKDFKKSLLIPASSIKGAISHRSRFYINDFLNNTINAKDRQKDKQAEAIHQSLFGSANDTNGGDSGNSLSGGKYKSDSANSLSKGDFIKSTNKSDSAKKGKLLISDIYLDAFKEQVFAHNSIDRFSAAAKGGALFQERAYLSDSFKLTIFVEKCESDEFKIALESFEKALDDICNALLPLGAMSAKGHGFFIGTLNREEV